MDKVLFWDGNKLCFRHVDYEKLKAVVPVDDLVFAGVVVTHKMHLESFENVIDCTPGISVNPTAEEQQLSTALEDIKVVE